MGELSNSKIAAPSTVTPPSGVGLPRASNSSQKALKAATLRDSELPIVVPSVAAPETARGRRVALSVLLFLSFAAAAWIASPLWVGMAFGTVMAFSMQRPYRRLCQKIGSKRGPQLSSAAVTLAMGAVCVAVGSVAVYVLTDELMTLVTFLQTRSASGPLSSFVGEKPAALVSRLHVNPDDVMTWARGQTEAASRYAAGAAAAVLQTTSSAVLGLIIALITMYYVLVEWPTLANRLERVSPLAPWHTRALILEVRDVGRSAFVGTLATAMIQGVLAWLGYTVLGVPRAVTWALLTALGSLLPVIGTAIVWAPVSGWLMMEGHFVKGVILVAWCVLIVTSLADYVIRPRIVGSSGHGHPLMMLVALVGGVEMLGLAGLIVGPIAMSLFLAALRLKERDALNPSGVAMSETASAAPGSPGTVDPGLNGDSRSV